MKKLLIILILIVFGIQVNATNYYVKTGGSDAASGLSDALAWETVTKVNSSMASFSAGDTIFFNRGDTFSGVRISIGKEGSDGTPIVLSAYGTGEKPIITSATGAIYIGGTGRGYWSVNNLDLRTSHATGYTMYRDSWPGDTLGPMPGWEISYCTIYGVIFLSGPNIHIHHNEFDGSTRATVGGGITLREGHSAGALIEYNEIHEYGDRGIWIMRCASNGIIRNNTIYDCYEGAGGDHWGTPVNLDGYSWPIYNWEVYNNYFYDNDGVGISMENGFNHRFYNNIVVGGRLGVSSYHYTGAYGDMRVPPSNDSIYYNLFINCNQGILCFSSNTNIIHNNVFWKGNTIGTERYGVYIHPNDAYGGSNQIINNIFTGGGWTNAVRSSVALADAVDVFDYNVATMASGDIWYGSTLANLQANGHMNNGIFVEPDFINPGVDFRLQGTSDAINAGTSLGYLLDLAGSTVGSSPDIGAYEYNGPHYLRVGNKLQTLDGKLIIILQ